MRKKRRRDNRIVKNVDFEKLRECLKKHGITQKELSIMCGYYPGYIEKNTLRQHYLTQHVKKEYQTKSLQKNTNAQICSLQHANIN